MALAALNTNINALHLSKSHDNEYYLIADICETLVEATVSNKMTAGLRCVINAHVMYHFSEKIPPGMYHYIIPVYNDELFAILRCMHERGAPPELVDAAFCNAFRCGALSYLHPNANAILLWRIRTFPPATFPAYMESFAKGLSVRPTRASYLYAPDICIMNALIDAALAGPWKTSEFVAGVAGLARVGTPFPLAMLHKITKYINRKEALTVLSSIIPTDSSRAAYISLFMGHWHLTQKELASVKILVNPQVIYATLADYVLSTDDVKWVLSETLRGVKMDHTIWRMVFKRKDYQLCAWLMDNMYLVPDQDLVTDYTNSNADARNFCDRLLSLYSMRVGIKGSKSLKSSRSPKPR